MESALSSGCDSLDVVLGGGFDRGTVTQIYGPPAAGKSNIALSTAVATAINRQKTVYVDTEGVSIDRLDQIASATATDCVSRDTITEQILFRAAHDFAEQEDAIRAATTMADDVSLIVVDSATGFYRLERTVGDDQDDSGESLRRLTSQITQLLSIARKHNLAVIITNQVYTDPETDRTRPLGGYTLEHWTGVVLRLERFRGGIRRATLEKHQSHPAGNSESFKITASGIEPADI